MKSSLSRLSLSLVFLSLNKGVSLLTNRHCNIDSIPESSHAKATFFFFFFTSLTEENWVSFKDLFFKMKKEKSQNEQSPVCKVDA